MTKNGKASADAPPLKLVTEPERRPLALTQWDWFSVALLCLALLLSPLGKPPAPDMPGAVWVAGFSTPFHAPFAAPTEFLELLSAYGVPLVLGLTGIACLISVWREWQRPVAVGGVPGLTGSVVVLLAWAGLSLSREHAVYTGLNAFAALLAAGALGGLITRLSRSDRGLSTFLLTLASAGTLVAAFGVNEYLAFWKHGDAIHRAYATFVNPDFAAGYLLLTLPPTLACMVATTERLTAFALGIGLALQSACLVATGSRTAVAALAFGLVVWLVLAVWTGAAATSKRKLRIGIALGIALLASLPASIPLRARVGTGIESMPAPAISAPAPTASAPSDTNSNPVPSAPASSGSGGHSGSFRRYTWIGTMNIVRANPVLGTGIGSFKNAYPRYAVTAYTFHAHNSYLQWMSETGIVGALLLLTALASVSAFVVSVLRTTRSVKVSADDGDNAPLPITRVGAFDEPRLILAALLAGLLASMAKSFADSDWYIVATLLALSANLALMSALARTLAPLSTQIPRPLSKQMLAACGAVALLILTRAFMLETAQQNWTAAGSAPSPQAINSAYQAAANADPFDPDARLALASLNRRLQQPEEERKALQEAAHVAPSGETYYRLAQFYANGGQYAEAVNYFNLARQQEPHNPQTLRALGEAFQKSGQIAQAKQTFTQITDLETAPYGTVRAVPEMPEIEFAYAHARLSEIAEAAGDDQETARQCGAACGVLSEYWTRRHWGTNLLSPDKQRRVADLYEEVLTRWLAAAKRLKRTDVPNIAALQTQVQTDRAQDEAAQNALQNGSGGSGTP